MEGLSPKRADLCNLANATRIAKRIASRDGRRVYVTRTECPMQPFTIDGGGRAVAIVSEIRPL